MPLPQLLGEQPMGRRPLARKYPDGTQQERTRADTGDQGTCLVLGGDPIQDTPALQHRPCAGTARDDEDANWGMICECVVRLHPHSTTLTTRRRASAAGDQIG